MHEQYSTLILPVVDLHAGILQLFSTYTIFLCIPMKSEHNIRLSSRKSYCSLELSHEEILWLALHELTKCAFIVIHRDKQIWTQNKF